MLSSEEVERTLDLSESEAEVLSSSSFSSSRDEAEVVLRLREWSGVLLVAVASEGLLEVSGVGDGLARFAADVACICASALSIVVGAERLDAMVENQFLSR